MRWLVSEIFDILLQFTMLLWLALGTVLGYQYLSIWGSVLGFAICLLTGSLIFGTIFVVLEINDHLKAIRKVLESPRNAATVGPSA